MIPDGSLARSLASSRLMSCATEPSQTVRWRELPVRSAGSRPVPVPCCRKPPAFVAQIHPGLDSVLRVGCRSTPVAIRCTSAFCSPNTRRTSALPQPCCPHPTTSPSAPRPDWRSSRRWRPTWSGGRGARCVPWSALRLAAHLADLADPSMWRARQFLRRTAGSRTVAGADTGISLASRPLRRAGAWAP